MINLYVMAQRRLGLSGTLSKDGVRQARRALARLYHPDNSVDPKAAAEQMAVINAAADTLLEFLGRIENAETTHPINSNTELVCFGHGSKNEIATKPACPLEPNEGRVKRSMGIQVLETAPNAIAQRRHPFRRGTAATKTYQATCGIMNCAGREHALNHLI